MSTLNEGPAITEHVLENLPDISREPVEGGYEVLNAPSLEEGDTKFVNILVENLPELSEMTSEKQEVKGSINLYSVEVSGRKFFVKEFPSLKFATTKGEAAKISDSRKDTYFERMGAFYQAAQPYIGDYLPLTVFTKRLSKETGHNEYLILQEVCEGNQFKSNLNGYKVTNHVETTSSQRQELIRFFNSLYILYEKTGYLVADLDFILNMENNSISLFDYELMLQVKGAGGMTVRLMLACEAYGIEWEYFKNQLE